MICKAQMIFLMAIMSVFSCKEGKRHNHSDLISKKKCISNILKQDDSLGKLRNESCKQISLSQSIVNYSNEINKLDYDNCPKLFHSAFKAHQTTWNEITTVTNKYPNLRGEMHGLFDQIKIGRDSTQFKILLKNIWDTWAIVEKTSK